jgi:hypothetical protein
MSKPAKAEDFLAKMNFLNDDPEPVAVQPVKAPAKAKVEAKPVTAKPRPVRAPAIASAVTTSSKAPPSRMKLKHIGAYLEREDCEKIALLRARLDVDNSQLIAMAINLLYKSEATKRKFGDA